MTLSDHPILTTLGGATLGAHKYLNRNKNKGV